MRIMLFLLATLFSLNLQAQNCYTDIQASTPSSRFILNNDATVTDTQTGLMWKQCLEGITGSSCDIGSATNLTWDAALQAPETLNSSGGFAGYTDWRLPNIKELQSIVETRCVDPAVNMDIFLNDPGTAVWSGSPYAYISDYAWLVNFDTGYSFSNYRYSERSVRLVRSGQ